jgi:hypothetical protein
MKKRRIIILGLMRTVGSNAALVVWKQEKLPVP